MQQKILILDNHRRNIESLRSVLEQADFEVIAAYSANEARKRLEDKVFHMVIICENIMVKKGQNILEYLQNEAPGVPGMVLASSPLSQPFISQIRQLRFPILSLSSTPSQIIERIQDSLASQKETPGVRPSTIPEKIEGPGTLLGTSLVMQQLRETLAKVAETDAPVLLRGETGTGKELAARALHSQSSRREQGFVAVNCAALTETLLESELFGHEKGAFTGAHKQKLGKFEFAGRGTLFLDEIGDISPHLQAKFLRVLDDRVFERVGGNRVLPVRCRIIAASNIDFPQAIESGRFRKDLYYRLNVVSIQLPPLRDRWKDLPELVRHFLKVKSDLYHKSVSEITSQALAPLQSYSWPGNVRELENIIEREVILAHGPRLDFLPLPEEENDLLQIPESPGLPAPEGLTLKEYQDQILMHYEREYFDRLLKIHGGHISKTAAAARIDRKTFYRKIKHCGIDPQAYKGKKWRH